MSYKILVIAIVAALAVIATIALVIATTEVEDEKQTEIFINRNGIVIFTDPDPYEHDNPDFDINNIGFTSDGNPYLTVHGTPGGTRSTTPGVMYVYYIQVADTLHTGSDRYIIASHNGFEDSTETKDDTNWHAHRIVSLDISENCSSADDNAAELVLTEDGKALVSPNEVVFKDIKPSYIYEVATFYGTLATVDGHLCLINPLNFDIITMPDSEL